MSVPEPQAIAAPTITGAEVEPALDAVAVAVTVPAGAVRLYVWRVGPSGIVAYVRGAYGLAVLPGSVQVLRDFEVPLGVPIVYHAVAASPTEQSPEATPVTVTVPADPTGDPWLVDLAQPANTQRVVLEQLAQLDYEVPVGVHYVLDRRTPITTSDISRAPRFELTFATADDLAAERARAALGDASPLLLRTPAEHGVGNLYLAVTGWSERRPSRLALHADRRFACSCVQIERPDPELWVPDVRGETYAAVRAEFATYADVEAGRDNYDQLLHAPIDEPPGPDPVVPWPPHDV